ncbi:MAG: hypothetical protein ACXVCH_08080, partial [Bdellovibrionota bacterium]
MTIVTPVQASPPIVTITVPLKPVPVIVTGVLLEEAPMVGVIAEIDKEVELPFLELEEEEILVRSALRQPLKAAATTRKGTRSRKG